MLVTRYMETDPTQRIVAMQFDVEHVPDGITKQYELDDEIRGVPYFVKRDEPGDVWEPARDYPPITPTRELERLIADATRFRIDEVRESVSACCDFCPRHASHRLALDVAGSLGDAIALVCVAHARHAAICLVGKL